MARKYTEDTTNVFRQKVTRKGYRPPSPYNSNDTGNEYQTVEFYGPYLTRNVGGNPWMNVTDKTVTVEIQKLSTTEHGLEWLTEKSRVIEREED